MGHQSQSGISEHSSDKTCEAIGMIPKLNCNWQNIAVATGRLVGRALTIMVLPMLFLMSAMSDSYGHQHYGMSINGSRNPTITVDGSEYPVLSGLMWQRTNGTSFAHEGGRNVVETIYSSKFPLGVEIGFEDGQAVPQTYSGIAGKMYGTRFAKFGTWFVERESFIKSDHAMFFIPNERNINKLLLPGETAVQSFTAKFGVQGTNYRVVPLTISVTIKNPANSLPIISFSDSSIEYNVTERDELELVIESNFPPKAAEDEGADTRFHVVIRQDTAMLDSDYQVPGETSEEGNDVFKSYTLPKGESSIQLSGIELINDTDFEENETFTVQIRPAINDDFVLRDAGKLATITIFSDDPPEISSPPDNCHDETVTGTPYVNIAFDATSFPDSPFIAAPTTVKLKSFDPANPMTEKDAEAMTSFGIDAYRRNGTEPTEEGLVSAVEVATSGSEFDYELAAPTGFVGYLDYRIAPSTGTGNQLYDVVEPCQVKVWHTSPARPGISIEIKGVTVDPSTKDKTIEEGAVFVVELTATPAPDRDIEVPISYSDSTRLSTSAPQFVTIRKGETTARVNVVTLHKPSDQENDNITVSIDWRSSYFLDESVRSDTVTLVDHTKVIANFYGLGLGNFYVKEGQDFELEVRLTGLPSCDEGVTCDVLVPISIVFVRSGSATAASEDDIMLPSGITVPENSISAKFNFTIPEGKDRATLSIPIVDDGMVEGVEFIYVIINTQEHDPETSRITEFGDQRAASVYIDSIDPPPLPSTRMCGGDVPEGTTPQVQVNWSNLPTSNYLESNNTTAVNIGFSNPENGTEGFAAPDAAQYIYTQFYINETLTNDNKTDSRTRAIMGNAGDTSVEFTPTAPLANYRGQVKYQISPSNTVLTGDTNTNNSNNTHYEILEPCEFSVWFVDAARPGLSLSIEEDSVVTNGIFKIKGTLSHGRTSDIPTVVPITFADESLVNFDQPKVLWFNRGQTESVVEVRATQLPEGTDADVIEASIDWGSSYYLDEASKSASIKFIRSDLTLGFSNPTYRVFENVGTVELEVNLSATFDENITINYRIESPVAAGVGTAYADQDFTVPANLSTEIEAGQTMATISIPIIADDDMEDPESFTVTLHRISSSLVGLGESIATVTISEPPVEPTPVVPPVSDPDEQEDQDISISADPTTFMEGGATKITIECICTENMDQVRVFPITVIQSHDLIANWVPSSLTMNSGSTSTSLSIATNPNTLNTDETGTITVRVYRRANPPVLADEEIITVSNREEEVQTVSVANMALERILTFSSSMQLSETPSAANVPSKPVVRIRAVNAMIEEGENVVFELSTLNDQSALSLLNIQVELSGEGVLSDSDAMRTVTIDKGETSALLSIPTLDDSLAEDDTMVRAVIQSGDDYQVSTESSAWVNVSDVQDRNSRRQDVQSASRAIFPDLAAAIGARSFDVADSRISHAFANGGETVLQLGGQSTIEGIIRKGGYAINKNELKWRQILGDSSMAINLYPEWNGSSIATVWAEGDHREVSSQFQSWNGDIFTGHIGIDARLDQNTLVGVSTFTSESNSVFEESEGSRLDYDIRTTGIQPYIGYHSPSGEFQFQSVAGYGSGRIHMEQNQYNTLIMDSSLHTLGMGIRQDILSGVNVLGGEGGLSVASEGWKVEQFVEAREHYIGSMHVDVQHVRAFSEGKLVQTSPVTGQTFSQIISVGLLENSENSMSTSGMELSGVFEFEDPSGTDAVISGQTLIDNMQSVREWSVRSNLNYDWDKDGKGVQFRLSPSWMQSGDGIYTSLWNKNLVNSGIESKVHSNGWVVDSEIGYGITMNNDIGLATPYGGLKFAERERNRAYFGGRFSNDLPVSLDVESYFDSADDGKLDQGIQFSGRVRW